MSKVWKGFWYATGITKNWVFSPELIVRRVHPLLDAPIYNPPGAEIRWVY